MTTLKPQKRDTSKKENSYSMSESNVTSRFSNHDEYELEYFADYDHNYYNRDEEDEDYTSWFEDDH